MTARDLYDAALIEINKLEAPSMLLEDYNYFINKAIHQYINKAYNRYEINQQATDDLMALRTTSVLPVISSSTPTYPGESKYYYCEKPNDYWHMLSCILTFNKPSKTSKCDKVHDVTNDDNSVTKAYVSSNVRKMTSDLSTSIINNAYFKPSYKTPYYSVAESTTRNDVLDEILYGKDCANDEETVKDVVINLYCGKTDKVTPTELYINYLRKPKKIEITDLVLDGEDSTEEMEFPDYVCYEIINEFVKLLLENTSDPRLQTNVPINQTVIPPVSE